jgi:Tfp pilus assembly protein PilN
MPANRSTARNALLGILAVIALVAVVVLIYVGGWWVTKDSTNRQTTIDRQSTAFVTSRIAKVRDDLIEISDLPEGPQKVNIVRGICAAVADIRDVDRPDDIVQFAAANC